MVTKEETNKKMYTEEGLKILTNRIKSWCDLFNKNTFPFSSMMFGVGNFSIENREECLIRIKELTELTGFQVKKETTEEHLENGEIIKKEVLKY